MISLDLMKSSEVRKTGDRSKCNELKASYYTTVIYLKVGTIMYIDNNVKNVLSDIEARAKGGSLLIFAHQHQHYITHILWLGKKSRNPRSYFF